MNYKKSKVRYISKSSFLALALLVIVQALFAQNKAKRSAFFDDSTVLEMEVVTDLRYLLAKKPNEEYLPAKVTIKMKDGTELKSDTVGVRTRGNYRRENCELASLMFQFNYNKEARNELSSLKKLKFVAGCRRSPEVDELVIKEYLAYKIYQLHTPLSFKVRLVRTHFVDVNSRSKSYWQYCFFIEDVDDLADRNDMLEKYNHGFMTEQTNRAHTTVVSMFQYMIGNTDWAVPNDHNIKLVAPKSDTMLLPYIIPYDFDYCGFVNASYAIPHETLGIDEVTTRLYRGFDRRLDELQASAALFLENKNASIGLIENCEWLDKRTKRTLFKYLDEFYDAIDDDKDLTRNFVAGARDQ